MRKVYWFDLEKKEVSFSDFLLVYVGIAVVAFILAAISSVLYDQVCMLENFPVRIFTAIMIVLPTVSLSLFSLELLEKKTFKKAHYFWFYFLPCLNIVIFHLVGLNSFYNSLIITINKYMHIYKEMEKEELEETLKSMVAGSKKMNENIKKTMSISPATLNKYTEQLLEESIMTLQILQGK